MLQFIQLSYVSDLQKLKGKESKMKMKINIDLAVLPSHNRGENLGSLMNSHRR